MDTVERLLSSRFPVWDPEILGVLNSATKYPSIPTYHMMDTGKLLGEHPDLPEDIIATEKVDGANARIVMLPDGRYLIGNRNEFLWYSEDVLYQPNESIVETIRGLFTQESAPKDYIEVIFGEVYGMGVLNGRKVYGSERSMRVFDSMLLPLAEFIELVGLGKARTAEWRDCGGQNFMNGFQTHGRAEECGFETVPVIAWNDQPCHTLEETLANMRTMIDQTGCGFDEHDRAEGIVIRNTDRSFIAKLRFEDYEKSLRSRK